MPHATHHLLDHTLIFLMVLDQPVDYAAIDNEPVDICFFVLAPESAQQEHLELLARIAQVCAHPSFTKGIRGGNSPKDILQYVRLCATRIP